MPQTEETTAESTKEETETAETAADETPAEEETEEESEDGEAEEEEEEEDEEELVDPKETLEEGGYSAAVTITVPVAPGRCHDSAIVEEEEVWRAAASLCAM